MLLNKPAINDTRWCLATQKIALIAKLLFECSVIPYKQLLKD